MTKPLRILILTNRIPYPLHDGGALAMDAIIRGYHQAGMQVHLLAMNTTRHAVPAEKLATLYPEIHGFDTIAVNNDVKPLTLIQNLLFSKLPEHVQRFDHPAFAAKLTSILQTFRPDVVQVESPFLSSYLPFIKNAVTVIRVHNVEYQIWERLANEKGGVKGFYLKLLSQRMRCYEETIWKDYDLLLPITEVDAAVIHGVHPKQQLLVAPYGITVSTNEQILPGDFTKAYHIGAMDWLPNAAAMDWLLQDIWPEMKTVIPAAEFHFGGRNMPERFFSQLPEGAYCHGEVPDLEQFYQGKNVLLVPLRAGGGIRIKILEAMAAGKLVISTAIGMQGINATPDIHYLEANTPEDFKKAFSWTFTHPEEALVMCRNGLKLIQQQYSNEAIISHILDRLQMLCGK